MVNPLKIPAAEIPEDNSLQLAANSKRIPPQKKRMKSTTGWWFKPSLKPPTRQAGAFFLSCSSHLTSSLQLGSDEFFSPKASFCRENEEQK